MKKLYLSTVSNGLILQNHYIVTIKKYFGIEEELIEEENAEKEENLIRMIGIKVGDDEMSTLVQRLKRENEAIRRETREKTRLRDALRVITKMLKNGEPDEKIKMYTDATDEQIRQRKKQLGLINENV